VQIDGRREQDGALVPDRTRLLGDARSTRLRGTVHAASGGSITLAAGGVLLSIDLATHEPLSVGARVDLAVGFAGRQLVLARVDEVEIEQEEADDDDDGVVEHEHEDQGDDHGGGDDHSGRGGGADGGGGRGDG
jgi:hypothetical protein